MPSLIVDTEFGEMVVKRSKRSKGIRIHIGTDGRYVISAPFLAPVAFIKLTINQSRQELRKLADHSPKATIYQDGQPIGRKHTLAVVRTGMVESPAVKTERNRLLVLLPPNFSIEQTTTQQLIRDQVVTILRAEAKRHLPAMLKDMAQRYGFSYQRLRFSHSGGRWGSCSSTGTISLNIALMKLSDDLIYYVLAHELSHTRQMNHSAAFWREVSQIDPRYKLHRQQLKRQSPIV